MDRGAINSTRISVRRVKRMEYLTATTRFHPTCSIGFVKKITALAALTLVVAGSACSSSSDQNAHNDASVDAAPTDATATDIMQSDTVQSDTAQSDITHDVIETDSDSSGQDATSEQSEADVGDATSEEQPDATPPTWVRYSDFGALGDGKTDDIAAIVAAHEYANSQNLPVKADDGATYYIGGKRLTADIRTTTDFGNASFIIDDRHVADHGAPVFTVSSNLKPNQLIGLTTLQKHQDKVDVSLPGPGLIEVTNSNVKHYIRLGANQNDGNPQYDIFAVSKDGSVDKSTPIIWNFDEITDHLFIPIDESTLTITGGTFTTIANAGPSEYTYYNRGLTVSRSNVVIDGLKHYVTGEGSQGAPYYGFIHVMRCMNVKIRNTIFTGHKTYKTVGSSGQKVSMGTYDVTMTKTINVTLENCSQSNDINNTTYWGIMSSNYCKNLVYDGCKLSRFDAHMGVVNATIRNSTLGHQGINAIGFGQILVDNSVVNAADIVNLRSDYGSTWEGKMILRKVTFYPTNLTFASSISLIGGENTGKHDFGYTCYMPEEITLQDVQIMDDNYAFWYNGPAIFANFNSGMKDSSYVETYPYIRTKKVILNNVKAQSDKPIRVSDNTYMFKDVVIVNETPP